MAVEIFFLNVGHGDCTFIKHANGHLTMIDVNNSKSLPEEDQVALAARHHVSRLMFKGAGVFGKSLEDQYEELLVDPYEFYKDILGGESIFRYIQTHPDLDHMSGLSRFFWQERVDLINFWDTKNSREIDEADFEGTRYDYSDWLVYKLLQAGMRRDNETHTVLRLNAGAVGDFYTGDGLSIFSPSSYLESEVDKDGKRNNLSYVLRMEHAGRRVIFPGDAESAAWNSIMINVSEADLDCDILKASHHGRESGYHKEATDAMDPAVVVCSVGKVPATDASDEYEGHGADVYTTREHGTIKVKIWDDGDIWMYDHAGNQIATL